MGTSWWSKVGLWFGAGIAVAAVVPSGAQAQDFCWRDSYGRGAGHVPGDCADGQEKLGLLCYDVCAPGTERVALNCLSVCPAGMRDDGLYCRAEYSRGMGVIGKGKCEDKHGAGTCESKGGLWYEKCDPGFKQGTTVNFCAWENKPDCGALGFGKRVADYSCTKKITGGQPGVGGCGPNEEKDAGLCYKQCKPGYKGVGPVCWGQAPAGWGECGMGAAKDSGTCASVIFSQVSSVAQLAATAATLGSSCAAEEAANGGKQASRFPELQAKFDSMKKAFQAFKESAVYREGKAAVDMYSNVKKADAAIQTAENAVTSEDIARAAAQLASILDPTGISATIAAYTYPKCSKYFQPSSGAPVTSAPAGVQWTPGGEGTPNAVIAGMDGDRKIEICRINAPMREQRFGRANGGTCEYDWYGRWTGTYADKILTNTSDVLTWKQGPAIPARAFVGGQQDGQNLYVCRTVWDGESYVGTVIEGECWFPHGYDADPVSDFEVLAYMQPEPAWVPSAKVSGEQVVGGQLQGNNVTICRTTTKVTFGAPTRNPFTGKVIPAPTFDTYLVGKVVNDTCDVAFRGKELLNTSYEVLTSGTGVLSFVPGPQIPANAVDSSYGYSICRAKLGNDTHPGIVVTGSETNCVFGWAGQAYSVPQFEVLIQK